MSVSYSSDYNKETSSKLLHLAQTLAHSDLPRYSFFEGKVDSEFYFHHCCSLNHKIKSGPPRLYKIELLFE